MRKSIGIILFFIIWEITSRASSSPAMPSLLKVISELYQLLLTGEYWHHIAESLKVVGSGIGIAVIVGLATGIIMHEIRFINDAFMAFIEMVRGVSALTLFPLLIILLGIGISSRIFIIFWTAWPAVMLSTIEGLNVSREPVEAAMMDGANRMTIMARIKIPLASPVIMTGIRIGCSGGWISLIAAEMLGANAGLGYFLLYCSQAFLYSRVYASIVMIALLGGGMNGGLRLFSKYIEKRYNTNEKASNIRSNPLLAIGSSIAYRLRKTG